MGKLYVLIFRFIYYFSDGEDFVTMNKCLLDTILSVCFYIKCNKKHE